MDSIKAPIAPKTFAPRDPVTVRGAAETDLTASKTVGATGDGESRSRDQRQGDHRPGEQQRADHPPQEVVVDPASREMIYRERDVSMADREHPDQALLRQRAYQQAPREGDAPPPSDVHANIKA